MQSLRIRSAWTGVGLAFLFMLINFADKAVVGLSSTPIMRDLGLSRAQFGLLGSAFFLLFSISGVGVGFLANRVSTKAIMLVMSVVWSATLLPLSALSSFTVLLASRVVLGAAEGPAFPVALHAIHKWFDNAHRALPTSIVASGAAFGTGIVAPLITWCIVHYGWHAAFGTLGVAGLIWACLWLALAREGPADAAPEMGAVGSGRVPYAQLLLSRTAVGVYLGGFAAYWVIALNIVWLADYLRTALHMPPVRAAWVIALPAAMQLVIAPTCAYLSQILSLRGYSSRISRGLLGAVCVMISGASMVCLPFAGVGALEVSLVGLSFSIGSVMFTLGATLIGEISPVPQRAAALGITNSIHTLAGLWAPFVMGRVVDIGVNPIAGFRAGYLYAGALVTVLGLVAALLIDPQGDLARLRPSAIFEHPARVSRSAS
jgi:MFS transporter, ACS family, D-galactonate transporter